MVRRIKGLIHAEPLQDAPWTRTKASNSARAAGRRYEKGVAKALPQAHWGQWYSFEDRNGPGHAQTDGLLHLRSGKIVVLECKLRYTPDAWDQLLGLYKPILEHIYGLEVLPVVVTKVLASGYGRPTTSLQDACENWQDQPVLHWIGNGPFLLDVDWTNFAWENVLV